VNADDPFEQTVLPHLDAGFNLARWLTGSERDAEDVLQDACLRALKFFSGFRGGNARAWFLTIVRHTTWTWLRRGFSGQAMCSLSEVRRELRE